MSKGLNTYYRAQIGVHIVQNFSRENLKFRRNSPANSSVIILYYRFSKEKDLLFVHLAKILISLIYEYNEWWLVDFEFDNHLSRIY